MARGSAEFRALAAALEDVKPPCRGDWRYVQDEGDLDPGDVAEMKAACRGCPVADLCARYAAVARPESGMWCGSYYPRRAAQGGST